MGNEKIIKEGAKAAKKLAKGAVVIAGPIVIEEAKKIWDKEAPILFEKGKKEVLKIGRSKPLAIPRTKKLKKKNNNFGYNMKKLNKLFQTNKIDFSLFNYLSGQIVQYNDVLSYDCKTFESFFRSLIKNKDINQEQVVKRKYEFTRDKTIEYLENQKIDG